VPTPEPTPEPTPKPTATPKPAGDPILARFPELSKCPSQSNCYVYVIRSGNNLYSIANYYRVPLETIYSMNPDLRTSRLKVGMKIMIPTPRRP
jgi:hypothetical protein